MCGRVCVCVPACACGLHERKRYNLHGQPTLPLSTLQTESEETKLKRQLASRLLQAARKCVCVRACVRVRECVCARVCVFLRWMAEEGVRFCAVRMHM